MRPAQPRLLEDTVDNSTRLTSRRRSNAEALMNGATAPALGGWVFLLAAALEQGEERATQEVLLLFETVHESGQETRRCGLRLGPDRGKRPARPAIGDASTSSSEAGFLLV